MSGGALGVWMRSEWSAQQRLAIAVTESLHRHIKVRWWQRKPSRFDLLPLGALVAADVIAVTPTTVIAHGGGTKPNGFGGMGGAGGYGGAVIKSAEDDPTKDGER